MHAAGYDDLVNDSAEEYEVSVDPELLRFLTRFPREQQAHLLRLLEGLDGRRPDADSDSDTHAPATPTVSATPRRNRSRVGAR
jgi:hypothetical protein